MKKNKFLCGLTAASIFIGASLGAFTASADSETNYTLEELFAMSDEEFLALDTAQELYETVKKDAENAEQTPDFTIYGGISGDLYVNVVTMGEKSYTANITESDIEYLLGDSVKYDMYSPIYSMITDGSILYDYLLWITLPELKKEYDEVSEVDILNMTKAWYCVNQVIDITYNPCHNLLDRPSSTEQVITGDVNLDKKVNVTDVEYMLMDMNGKIKFTDPQKHIADVNGDGNFDEKDSKQLLFSMFDQGDVNMDENIDLYDAIEIAKSMAKVKTLTDVEFVLADMDENGKVDLYDAIYVAECMIGKHK